MEKSFIKSLETLFRFNIKKDIKSLDEINILQLDLLQWSEKLPQKIARLQNINDIYLESEELLSIAQDGKIVENETIGNAQDLLERIEEIYDESIIEHSYVFGVYAYQILLNSIGIIGEVIKKNKLISTNDRYFNYLIKRIYSIKNKLIESFHSNPKLQICRLAVALKWLSVFEIIQKRRRKKGIKTSKKALSDFYKNIGNFFIEYSIKDFSISVIQIMDYFANALHNLPTDSQTYEIEKVLKLHLYNLYKK